MSFMKPNNILTEAEIDKVLQSLRKAGKKQAADKIEKDRGLQKKAIKLNRQIEKSNNATKELERLFKKKLKYMSIVDYF